MFFNRKKKKKEAEEAALRASLSEKLARYEEKRLAAQDEDITDTTWTDVEIDGTVIRIPKISPKAVEKLNEAAFEQKVQAVGVDSKAHSVDKDIDPWNNSSADVKQWRRESRHKK